MNNFEITVKNPTWWRRRTSMERYCTVLAAVAILLCGVLIITAAVYVHWNEGFNDDERDICLTPGCIYTASEVLKRMNRQADPCDDFYEFACGNFLKETKIPDDKEMVISFNLVEDKVREQLRLIIEEPSTDDESRPFRMVKDLYKSCMNKTKIEEIGLSYINKLIQKVGGWPVLEGDRWDASKFTWKDTLYKFRDEGFSIDLFITFYVWKDFRNSTKSIIVLDQASLFLNRRYLVKGMEEKVVQALYKYMVDIAVLFGADRNRAKKELKEALDFEIQLAIISVPEEERRNSNRWDNPMTIPQLQEKFPSIPWAEYISTIVGESVTIQPDEVINVNEPTYIKELEKLLSTTPKRTQANYMMWRAIELAVPSLTENLRKCQLEYLTVLDGKTEREPRWEECVKITAERTLSLAASSLYVQRFFKQEAKKDALEMVDNIRKEMYNILQTLDWMDEETRKHALEKARAMISYIAYPDEILDVTKLEDHYQQLEITQGNYLRSVLNWNKFEQDYFISRLRKPFNKTDWITHGPATFVNAFYDAEENSIWFPAAILQGEFFSYDRPNYMNYGAIGLIIGHEISHGFDDQGRQFDKDGLLVDWWAAETKEAYLEKAACIVYQYGNYTAEDVGMNLNGVNTQGENIADIGAIKQAYRAYNQWVAEHGTEKRLPGLQDFTPQQMFWISGAIWECTKIRPEALKKMIVTDPHSPGEFRVRGEFSNSHEFAVDFKCSSGSKMNPTEKCQVW